MDLINILSPDAVNAHLSASSKKRLMQEIAQTAEAVYDLPSKDVFNALQARELLGPTGMGNGVAIPHARMSCIDRVKGIFLRLDKAVEYESVDGQPIDLVFALLAPEGAGAEHLKSLARVSRLLRDHEVCEKLRSSDNPAALFAILTADYSSKAA